MFSLHYKYKCFSHNARFASPRVPEWMGVARRCGGLSSARAFTSASSRAASFALRHHFISLHLDFYSKNKRLTHDRADLAQHCEDIPAARVTRFHGKWRDGLTRGWCWWWWWCSADRGPQWTRSRSHSITRKRHQHLNIISITAASASHSITPTSPASASASASHMKQSNLSSDVFQSLTLSSVSLSLYTIVWWKSVTRDHLVLRVNCVCVFSGRQTAVMRFTGWFNNPTTSQSAYCHNCLSPCLSVRLSVRFKYFNGFISVI